jgi:hypothetical protein
MISYGGARGVGEDVQATDNWWILYRKEGVDSD